MRAFVRVLVYTSVVKCLLCLLGQIVEFFVSSSTDSFVSIQILLNTKNNENATRRLFTYTRQCNLLGGKLSLANTFIIHSFDILRTIV